MTIEGNPLPSNIHEECGPRLLPFGFGGRARCIVRHDGVSSSGGVIVVVQNDGNERAICGKYCPACGRDGNGKVPA